MKGGIGGEFRRSPAPIESPALDLMDLMYSVSSV
jgi:hypothetical protein